MSGDLDALLRVTSPGYRGHGPPDIAFGTTESPAGTLVIAVTARGVAVCSYDDEHAVYERVSRAIGTFIGPDPRRLDPVRRELDAYFSGRLRTFTAKVDLQLATAFARSVLSLVSGVPYGTTTTYRAMAERIGRPRALRAVGNALTANPVCVISPCHRVVDDDGPGAYAGGTAAKELLLRLEARP
ncbi:methylated-DNA--[protein]-cysteine S-methyltransferase [Spongiactinospora gelatinilytica]|uniref:Methylated-DNA--[protein]-cysteine S-methyltransferase n=1 Tax=Spongiactinospora gelatinilytica TaxID=2666298 RepID=A0A2W2HDZ4_9ACTN|nr:methylated-DNA--[protein]-cysteine S-methyltransferase [Spongiactinospora gelatinilytica]PZG44427.1 methylated-DNA--[protein]-cysteine S-methyltransferase [Spongiactinospora gelatinilytica]